MRANEGLNKSAEDAVRVMHEQGTLDSWNRRMLEASAREASRDSHEDARMADFKAPVPTAPLFPPKPAPAGAAKADLPPPKHPPPGFASSSSDGQAAAEPWSSQGPPGGGATQVARLPPGLPPSGAEQKEAPALLPPLPKVQPPQPTGAGVQAPIMPAPPHSTSSKAPPPVVVPNTNTPLGPPGGGSTVAWLGGATRPPPPPPREYAPGTQPQPPFVPPPQGKSVPVVRLAQPTPINLPPHGPSIG